MIRIRRSSALFQLSLASIVTVCSANSVHGQFSPDVPEEAVALSEDTSHRVLYFFQHFALRDAAFQFDRNVQELIDNPRQAGRPIARLFGRACLRAADPDYCGTPEAVDGARDFMRQIGFNTVQYGGYTIHLMSMPPPQYPPEAYFIAIVYKDGESLVEGAPAPSTRYITFERTAGGGHIYALGEWTVDGNHETYSFGDTEPTARGFIANVYAMIDDR